MSTEPIPGPGAAGNSDLIALAENILEQTKGIVELLKANEIPLPTLDAGSKDPPDSPEYRALYNSLKGSLDDLNHLVTGPKRWMRTFVCRGNDLGALQVAFEFDFFNLVPLEGDISIESLAEKAGLDADRTARCIRMLITHNIFKEARPGFISHSAASYVPATNEDMHCAGHYIMDEMLKAATATADCFKEFPDKSDSEHTVFQKAHGVPVFQYYGQHPQRAVRFAKAMGGITKMDRQIDELRDRFPWQDLSGTVVDVGGGNGHVTMALAQSFPNVNFIVQDVNPSMIAQGEKMLPPALKDRITFMQYDFFTPQPQRDVAAFFMRQCTHNWSDEDVVRILKSFVPGLEGSKPGTPLVINDTVMPVPGTWPTHEERAVRQLDILMMIGMGAKQRTQAEFEDLLRRADPRYKIKNVHADKSMGLLVVHLEQ